MGDNVVLLETTATVSAPYTKVDVAYKACKNVLKFGDSFDCQMFTEILKAKTEAEKMPFVDVKELCVKIKTGIAKVPLEERVSPDEDMADVKDWCSGLLGGGSVTSKPKNGKIQCD